MKKIKGTIVNFGKKHHYIIKIVRCGNFTLKRLKYRFNAITNRVDPKLIMFESFAGRKYWDSPKALYEAMLNDPKYKDYKFVWAFREPEKYDFLKNNRNTIVVKTEGKYYYKYYAKSKYWIINYRLTDVIFKKKNQVYVQCWHGTPLKRLGCDIEVEGNLLSTKNEIHKQYTKDSKRYNYMISPSAFCTEKFASAFGIKDKSIFIEEGYPRNDAIVNHTEEDIINIKKKLNIPNDKKVILYAPTFRDNQHDGKIGYTYKTELDFELLKKEFSKDYIILFRAHYLVANSFDFNKYKGFVYDVCNYDDINDLYIISDLLITDYSSVFFDYSILKRREIFYMYDLDEYKNNLRDFYFDLSILPGPIVKKEEDLIKEIKNSKNFKYDDKYRKFNDKFTYLEDGKASIRVLEHILGEKNEEEK